MGNLDNILGAWLKMVLPGSGVKELNERLGVIRTFAAEAAKKDIPDLILAFYSDATGQPTVHRLREKMRTIDTSFGPKDNAELAVLATGILYELIENGDHLAAAVALAILCAEFGSLSDTAHITDLVTRARYMISREGIRVREANLEIPNLGKTLRSAVDSEDEDADDADTDEDRDNEDSLSRVVDALSSYGGKIENCLRLIEARRAEQSDILYWLISGRREVGGSLLKGLKKEQAALFVAVELANLTRQIPGPTSASAVLSSLLEKCKGPNTGDVTLEMCIQSVGATEGSKYLAKQTVINPLISPISFALTKAEETGWQDGWQNAVKAQTRIPTGTKYSVFAIAEQLYREILLSRALKEN